ncbi:hypothetical protein [Chryseobacterium sp. SIMBA_029]|uniref:hypothetical protein n=2 Tax=Pseudomonadati TaxID=3379134 RepID=UPI0039790FDD
MNKFLLMFCFCVAGFGAKAQAFTEKNLQQTVLQFNTSKTVNDYDALFKKFSTANASERWQAYYYQSAAMLLKTDQLAKKGPAESLREPNALAGKAGFAAFTSQRDNAELNILMGLVSLQSIQLNFCLDVQKELTAIAKNIATAESSSPNNPRLAILKARIAERSGDKAEAEKQYQKALNEFTKYNSSDSSIPNWGRQLIPTNK